MKHMEIDQCRINVVNNTCVIKLVCPSIKDALNYKEAVVEAMSSGKFKITIESDHGNVVIIPNG